MTDSTRPPKIKPVEISTGNIPIGREKEPEKKNCACGGKGCSTHKPDTAQIKQ